MPTVNLLDSKNDALLFAVHSPRVRELQCGPGHKKAGFPNH